MGIAGGIAGGIMGGNIFAAPLSTLTLNVTTYTNDDPVNGTAYFTEVSDSFGNQGMQVLVGGIYLIYLVGGLRTYSGQVVIPGAGVIQCLVNSVVIANVASDGNRIYQFKQSVTLNAGDIVSWQLASGSSCNNASFALVLAESALASVCTITGSGIIVSGGYQGAMQLFPSNNPPVAPVSGPTPPPLANYIADFVTHAWYELTVTCTWLLPTTFNPGTGNQHIAGPFFNFVDAILFNQLSFSAVGLNGSATFKWVDWSGWYKPGSTSPSDLQIFAQQIGSLGSINPGTNQYNLAFPPSPTASFGVSISVAPLSLLPPVSFCGGGSSQAVGNPLL